jgi:hypothetical protein
MAKQTKSVQIEEASTPVEPTTTPAEPAIETPEAKKPKAVKKVRKGKKSEALAKTPPKKPARKPAKPKAKKAAKPGPRKVIEAKAEKPAGRKSGPKKKVAEKPTRTVAAMTKKKPGRKPGRPGKKAAALVPVARGRKLTARRADVIRKGRQALEFFLDQQRQIDEMAQVIANYERVFEAVRGLFSREMEEIEEFLTGLLE